MGWWKNYCDKTKKDWNKAKAEISETWNKRNPEVPTPEQRPPFKSTSHIIHLIMCVLTGALWLPVWIVCALINSQANKKNGW